jgi:hypothetical protein
MAYIRFDQDPMMGAMFTADGRITSSQYASVMDLPQPIMGMDMGMGMGASINTGMGMGMDTGMGMGMDTGMGMGTGMGMDMGAGMNTGIGSAQPYQKPRRQLPNIRNMKELYRLIGSPDVIDKKNGGIAIWSADTLKKAGYGFLRRLEIIDESVPSVTPVKHLSNVYIWVHIKPTMDQLTNILSLSKDFFYDRKKELLIVRSDTLDTAVAQASLLLLYTKQKVTFYDLVSKDLLMNYYTGILPGRPKHQKVKKALYTILNTTKKMK